MSRLERKITVGIDHLFTWISPDPLDTTVTPTLTIRFASGDVSPVLVHQGADLTVTGISSDRRKFTSTVTLSGNRGMAGFRGFAWFVTDEDSAFQVKITRIVDGEIWLSAPLPRGVVGNGTIQYSIYRTSILAATLATVERSIPYSVSYTAKYGEDLQVEKKREEGIIHLVRSPFNTGLTSTDMTTFFPELAVLPNRSTQGFEGEISFAKGVLIAELRAQMVQSKLTEDELFGPSLMVAHSYYTAAHIFRFSDPERSVLLTETGKESVEIALRSVWVDSNKDGVVDEDEDVTHVTGGRSSDVGGSFSSTDDDPTFTIGWNK